MEPVVGQRPQRAGSAQLAGGQLGFLADREPDDGTGSVIARAARPLRQQVHPEHDLLSHHLQRRIQSQPEIPAIDPTRDLRLAIVGVPCPCLDTVPRDRHHHIHPPVLLVRASRVRVVVQIQIDDEVGVLELGRIDETDLQQQPIATRMARRRRQDVRSAPFRCGCILGTRRACHRRLQRPGVVLRQTEPRIHSCWHGQRQRANQHRPGKRYAQTHADHAIHPVVWSSPIPPAPIPIP